MLGAGLGAGAGLMHEAFLGDPNNTHYLTKALRGAGLGGFAGAAGGALLGASNLGKQIQYDLEDKATDWMHDRSTDVRQALSEALGQLEIKANPLTGKVTVTLPQSKSNETSRPEFNDK